MKNIFLFCLTALAVLSAASSAPCAESVPKKTYQKREKVFQKRTKTYQPRNTVRNGMLKKKEKEERSQNPDIYPSAEQGSRQFSGLSSATRITMPSIRRSYAEIPVSFRAVSAPSCSSEDGGCFYRAETTLDVLYSCQKGTVDVSMKSGGGDIVELSNALQQGTCRYDQALKRRLAYRQIAENVRKGAVDFACSKIETLFRNAQQTGTTCKLLGQDLSAVQSAAERYLSVEYDRQKSAYDAKTAAKGDPCAEKP